jgi:hypothetical protein
VTPSSTACVKEKENGMYKADGPGTSIFEHGSYPGHAQCLLAWVFVNESLDSR